MWACMCGQERACGQVHAHGHVSMRVCVCAKRECLCTGVCSWACVCESACTAACTHAHM